MSASASTYQLLAERIRRAQARAQEVGESETRQQKWQRVANDLLDGLFPQQREFWLVDNAKRKAALCSRRAGKTFGGARAFLSRALSEPKSRLVYINETRAEAKALLWDEPDDGIPALLMASGLKEGEDYRPNATELVIRFANGSIIGLFGADDERQVNKLRGRKFTAAWSDEAQKMPHLQTLIQRVLGASMKDFDGTLFITGTPSRDCAGYFYDVTAPDSAAPGWSVHRWTTRDNPFFGATPEERYARTAAVALEENGWTEADPDFRREWLGLWVAEDSRYVYPVHQVDPDALTFAPLRMTAAGLYDHPASVADLPRDSHGKQRRWIYSLGVDYGFRPDPFAVSLLAFSLEHEIGYEMWSWKKAEIDAEDWLQTIRYLVQCADNLASIVGDPAGTRALMKGWRERLGIPIEDADKNQKNTWIELMGSAIRKGKFKYRSNSPLLHEHRHLVWLPTATGEPKENKERRLLDGTRPGNHASDASLYAWRHMTNWLARPDVGPQTPIDRLNAEAERYERLAEEHSRAVVAQQAWEADPWATEGWEL